MNPARILIVDDDADITEAMRIVLESKGHTIDAAIDSKDAASRIKSQKPDLIILDVMMSTKSEGFDFARELKKDAKTRDIPILMLTAIKEKTGIDFKPAAGDETWLPVEDFLDKPVKPEQLIEKVESLLK
ncbi:MAG: response regulator [Sedimentisphaerales bacterium]|nr:response regulator [Sedimentisphaerales bacterium]